MPRPSFQSVEECGRSGKVLVLRLDREGTLERLRGRAPALVESCLEVLEVRLFGSFARGDARPGSDADFSIVVSDTPKAFVERIAALARRLSGVGMGCEVVVCTKR